MIKNKKFLFYSLLFFSTLFLSIGYANVNTVSLGITGNASAGTNGKIYISNVTIASTTGNLNADEPTFTDTSVTFGANFTLASGDTSALDEHSVTYDVTITNDSIISYTIGSGMFNPTLNTSAPSGQTLNYAYEVIGFSEGEPIDAKTVKTFQVKLTLYPSGGVGTYIASVNAIMETKEEDEGMVVAAFKDNINSGDLTGSNTVAPITVTVMNTYDESKTFNFSINNSNFTLVDASGNALSSFTIPANTESMDYTVYFKENGSPKFINSPQKMNLTLTTDDETISVGTVSMAVDVDTTILDKEAPVISSVTVARTATSRTLTASWEATDNTGIDHYKVELINSSGTVVQTANDQTGNSYSFNNVADGTYYVKVTAYDGANNSSNKSSSSSAYRWTYNITISCTNCSASNTTAEPGSSKSITITGASGYTESSPTISSVVLTDTSTNEQTTLSSSTSPTSYSYSSGSLSLSNIAGDITITASGVADGPCLVAGTRILLANGTYKNIEDINYDDLLAVWNYNNGTLTYEYPLWIENTHITNKYIKITFSDDSYIEIVGNHSFYNTETNLFFNVNSPDFKIGTNVAKIVNEKIESVKITNIETINKTTKYYFVGSTTYYNIIANNILTTDSLLLISNLYGFEDNATWPDNKNELVNANKLDYSYFEDVMPYYLYKGFRVEEAGYLDKYNLTTLSDFKNYIVNYITNPHYVRSPLTNSNNERLWMVTTSIDNVTNENKNNFLMIEGSSYTLPTTNDIIKWYSTSENKYYNPGDTITVNHGMHFIGIK